MDLVCIKRLDRTELDWKSDIKAVESDSNSDRVLCINWDRCLKCFFFNFRPTDPIFGHALGNINILGLSSKQRSKILELQILQLQFSPVSTTRQWRLYPSSHTWALL